MSDTRFQTDSNEPQTPSVGFPEVPLPESVINSPNPTAHVSTPSAWTGRVATVVVAALVGGLAGYLAAPSESGGTLTVNESTAAPAAASLPGGLTIPALVQRVQKAVVSIDVKGSGQEDQGTGMIITSSAKS